MEDVLGRVPARAPTRFPTLNVLLFLATLGTTLVSGWSMVGPRIAGLELPEALLTIARAGLPFAATLLGILFTHEMGHYVLARRYGVDTTLPFFIPAPLIGVGTFGAVIRIRSRMPSLRAVLDIGAAGPIAGFLVAVPLLLWGYAHSTVMTEQVAVVTESPLRWLLGWMGILEAAPGAGSERILVYGESLVTLAARAITHPDLPAGADIVVHPVAHAAWFGMLVTALNLFPLGQLDGGHVVYALLGRERARRISRAVSWSLLALGLLVSVTWLFWWLVTRFVVGYGHPPAVVEERLTPASRVLAIASLLLFAVTFTPIPIREGILP
jgi:membrane-associated protease RseP (regulator of RpoE activity)